MPYLHVSLQVRRGVPPAGIALPFICLALVLGFRKALASETMLYFLPPEMAFLILYDSWPKYE